MAITLTAQVIAEAIGFGAVINGLKSIQDTVIQIGQAAAQTFGDFEAQLNQISAVTDGTEKQFAALKQQALDLGAQTKFSASEAALGMSELAKSGFTAKQVFDAMPGTLALAAAGGVSVGQAAAATGEILQGFGLDVTQAGHMADVLAQAANKSAIGVTELQESMKYVAPVAKVSSQSLESMSAAIAIMGNAGIKGSTAGTTLRSALSHLQAPSKAAGEILQKFGVHIKDTQGKMLPLTQILQEMNVKMKGLSDVEKNANISKIFGLEALSGVQALMATTPAKIKAMEKAMYDANGASKVMADKMNQGLLPALEQMRGALETCAIMIGEKLAPPVIWIANLIGDLATKFSKLPGWVHAVTAVLGALVVGVIGASLAIGSLVLANFALTGALTGLATAGTIAAPTITAALTAMATSAWATIVPIIGLITPFLPLIAGIGIAIAAVAAIWTLNLGDIQGRTAEFGATFMEFWGGVANDLSGVWATIVGATMVAWDNIVYTSKTALGALDALFGWIFDVITGVWSGLILFVSLQWGDLWNYVVNGASKAMGALGNVVSSGINGMGNFIRDRFHEIANMAKGLWLALSNPKEGIALFEASMKSFGSGLEAAFWQGVAGVGTVIEDFNARGEKLVAPKAPPKGKKAEEKSNVPKERKAGDAYEGKDDDKKKKAAADKAAREALKAAKEALDAKKAMLDAEVQANKSAEDRRFSDVKVGIDRELAAVQHKREMKRITEQQYLDAVWKLKEQELQAEVIHSNNLLAIQKTGFVKQQADTKKVYGEKSKEYQELTKKIQGIDQQAEQNRKEFQNKKKANDQKHDDDTEVAAKKSAENRKKIDAQLLSFEKDSLAKRLKENEAHFAALLEQEGLTEEDKTKIRAAHVEADKKTTAEYFSTVMDGWNDHANKVVGMMDVIADTNKTSWAKLQATAGTAFGMFRKEIDAFAGPHMAAFNKALSEGGVESVLKLVASWVTGSATMVTTFLAQVGVTIGGYVSMGLAALGMSAAAQAAWLSVLGPIGLVIAAIAGVTLAVMGLIALFQKGEMSAKIKKELGEINASMLDGQLDRINAERDLAETAIREEIKEREKAGENREDLAILLNAKLEQLAKDHAKKVAEIESEAYYRSFDIRISAAQATGDTELAIELQKNKDMIKLSEDLAKDFKEKKITEQQYHAALAAGSALIEQKAAAETVSERESAHERLMELDDMRLDSQAETLRQENEALHASGKRTTEEYQRVLDNLGLAEDQREADRAAADVAFYQTQVNRADLSAKDREDIEAKLTKALVTQQKALGAAMSKELDNYTRKVEDGFKRRQELLQDEREGYEYARDVELRVHESRMKQYDQESKAQEKQIALIDERIKAINKLYADKKENANNTDAADFQKLMSETALTEQELTYDAIEVQRQSAENRFALEEITQEEYVRLASEALAKKAVLAQKELSDTRVGEAERVRIEKFKADAYKDFQGLRLELLDVQEEKEVRIEEKKKVAFQEELDRIQRQRIATQESIDRINNRYDKLITDVTNKLTNLEKEWKTKMKAIADGTDPETKRIADNWQRVSNSVNMAAAAQERYNRAAFSGSTNGYNDYSWNTGSIYDASGKVSGHKLTAFATGGYVRGGVKGQDSVPIIAQDGEYVTDVSLTKKLEVMTDWLMGLLRGSSTPSMAFAGMGGVSVKQITLSLNGVAIRNDEDIDLFAEKVGEILARNV